MRTKPTTLSHSATVVYVLKLSEYTQSVAGQGRQHVASRLSMGAQNLPFMTASVSCWVGSTVDSTYILHLIRIWIHPGTVQRIFPGDLRRLNWPCYKLANVAVYVVYPGLRPHRPSAKRSPAICSPVQIADMYACG